MSTADFQLSDNLFVGSIGGLFCPHSAEPSRRRLLENIAGNAEAIPRTIQRAFPRVAFDGPGERRRAARSLLTRAQLTRRRSFCASPENGAPSDDDDGGANSVDNPHAASINAAAADMPRKGDRPPPPEKAVRRRRGKFQSKGEARSLFRHTAKKVQNVLAWFSILEEIKDNELDRNLKTFTELAVEYQVNPARMDANASLSDDLHFDKNYYKANRDISLSQEIKDILTLRPNGRSSEMCNKVVHGLQLLKSFSDYPLHIQERLSAMAWYTTVTSKRLIIRQGHQAENFYFILSGQALVKVAVRSETGDSYNKTVAFLKRDDCFGEVGLLYRSKRTATVESATAMELLTVGRDDFLKIFMNTAAPGDEPEHVKFLRKLDFMKHWPVYKLLEVQRQCMMTFFRPNHVIFANSEETEYIYIVKSGKVQLLMCLSKPHGRQVAKTTSPRPPLPCGLLRQPSARIFNGRDPRPPIVPIDVELHALMMSFEHNKSRPPSQSSGEISPTDGDCSASEKAPRSRPKRENIVPGRSKGQSRSQNVAYVPKSGVKAEEEEDEFADPMGLIPCFVEVAVLEAKDVFGIHNLVYENEIPREQSVLSMVSQGAEVIMLNKRFFIQHMNDKEKLYIRENVRPYPIHDALQKKMQVDVDWGHFKKSVIGDCLTHRKEVMDLSIKH